MDLKEDESKKGFSSNLQDNLKLYVFLNNSYIDNRGDSGNEVGKLAIIFTLINHS